MAACAKCGAELKEGATFCGSCGAPVAAPAAAPASGGGAPAAGSASSAGMASNVAGALAYFTIIPAILFIVLEQFKNDKFVRFQAFQSLFFQLGIFVCWIPIMIVGWIPIIGWLILLLGMLVLGLGGFACWVFLVFKAYSNERFELPVIGKLAAEQAAK
ncbi:MAG TPA: zinc-ribbon domain-containing protein [Terriglobia bacterium]|nr:zinc-ribbon domain-containing protein [Terriglobia bacterium]